jgi:hypothetical protein
MVKRQCFYLALKLSCLQLLISMEELDLLVEPRSLREGPRD